LFISVIDEELATFASLRYSQDAVAPDFMAFLNEIRL
jgi:hypothetical protein